MKILKFVHIKILYINMHELSLIRANYKCTNLERPAFVS